MSDKPQQTHVDDDNAEDVSPDEKPLSQIFEEVAQREAELMVDDDEAEYVSLSGKPLAQLYKEVQEREALMADAERIKQLREAPDLFEMYGNPADDENES